MATRISALVTPTKTSSAWPPPDLLADGPAMPASGAFSHSVPRALATPSGPAGSGSAGKAETPTIATATLMATATPMPTNRLRGRVRPGSRTSAA